MNIPKPLRTIVILSVLMVAIVGCVPIQAPPTAEIEEPATGNTIEAAFVCPDGTSLETVFDNDAYNDAYTVTVTLPDGTFTLPLVESGSGAKYSDGSTTFWNKGDEAMVEVNGEIVYQDCVTE